MKYERSVKTEVFNFVATVAAISFAAFAFHRFRATKKDCEELRWINMRLEASCAITLLVLGARVQGKMAP